MVIISRVYTRTGDDGKTHLGDMSRTAKTDLRLAAYADTDETNSAIGAAIALGDLREDVVATLTRIQNDLFDVGADLCAPLAVEPKFPPLRVDQTWIDELEADCDTYNAELETLRSFILPGGTPGSALLHVARTVSRRAERSAWAAIDHYGDQEAAVDADPTQGGVHVLTAKYLNRLSDLLFVLARVANLPRGGDVLWQPGGGRVEAPARKKAEGKRARQSASDDA